MMESYEKMNSRLQTKLNRMSSEFKQILLLYGQVEEQNVRMKTESKEPAVYDSINTIRNLTQELLRSIIDEIPSLFENTEVIYRSIKENEYPYNRISVQYIKASITEYLSYIDGMEDFVILTFGIKDGELNQVSIDSKIDAVIQKDADYVDKFDNIIEKATLNDAMIQLEAMIDFVDNILTFSENVGSCAEALKIQLSAETSKPLKIAKIKAFCLYAASMMRFCSLISNISRRIRDAIDTSMKSRTPVSGEKDETLLKIV